MSSRHSAAHRASVRMAFCGMAAALSVAVMLLGGLIQIGAYAAPLFCGLLLVPVMLEFGKKWGWLVWGAVVALSLILGFDKEEAFFYAFVGWYPLIKWELDRRVRKKLPNLAIKLLIFAAAIAAMYALLVLVLRLAPVISDLGSVSAGVNAAFFALMLVSLLLYDRLLNPLMIVYAQRLRPRMKFL